MFESQDINADTRIDTVMSESYTIVENPQDWDDYQKHDFSEYVLDAILNDYGVDLEKFIPDFEDIVTDLDVLSKKLLQAEEAIYEAYPEDGETDFEIDDFYNYIANQLEIEIQNIADNNNEYFDDSTKNAQEVIQYLNVKQEYGPQGDYGYLTVIPKSRYVKYGDAYGMTVGELVGNILADIYDVYADNLEDFLKLVLEDNPDDDVQILTDEWNHILNVIVSDLETIQEY